MSAFGVNTFAARSVLEVVALLLVLGGNLGCSGSTTTSPSPGGKDPYANCICNALETCFNEERCVAKSVSIPVGYSIDATEVTRKQYLGWLAYSPPVSNQSAACSWNTSFAPLYDCMASDCAAADCTDYPQTCVDWCDAVAYCASSGKRLCGKVGGGSNAYGDHAIASKSQWYNACSAGGTLVYPYGDAYDPELCNGRDRSATGCPDSPSSCDGDCTCAAVEVATLEDCVSNAAGYRGVYDLSGNVAEWEDSCTDNVGGSDECQVRGGSFRANSSNLHCANDMHFRLPRSYGDTTGIGFRCCSP